VEGLTTSLLADGGKTTVDLGVATFLFLGAVILGFVGVQRLREKSFRRLPLATGWVAVGLAVAALVLAIVRPPIIRPNSPPARPASSARIRFVSPRPGQTFGGNPATVPLHLQLVGGRIVPFTSTRLAPNQGHIHLFLDGALVSMAQALDRSLQVSPGLHRLQAEFVAADHGPFRPRVLTTVAFRVVDR
jgi:hypothetical protein